MFACALAIVCCEEGPEPKGPLGMPDLSKNPLAKTAADLVKREARVLVLSESDVIGLLDLRELLDGLADGFRALAAGEIQTPERPAIASDRRSRTNPCSTAAIAHAVRAADPCRQIPHQSSRARALRARP